MTRPAAAALADRSRIVVVEDGRRVDRRPRRHPAIRTPEIDKAAAAVARLPRACREVLVARQRRSATLARW